MTHDHGDDDRRFLDCKSGADANARPDTKRKVRKAVDGVARCTEKPVRIETVGRPPQRAMPVKNIGRDDDHRSCLDRNAGKFIRSERNTAYGGDGRIEPVGFIDHRACFDQAIGQTLQLPIELAVGFGLDPLPPLLRLRQQEQRPGNAIRGGFMTGSDERQDIGADFGFRQRLATFRILRLKQQRKNIAWRVTRVLSYPLAAR